MSKHCTIVPVSLEIKIRGHPAFIQRTLTQIELREPPAQLAYIAEEPYLVNLKMSHNRGGGGVESHR